MSRQINQQIPFLEWLRNIWDKYVRTEYQGWDGTLINLQEEIGENTLELKSSYVFCLELYYHLRNLSIKNDNEETKFFRMFLELIISEEMDEVLLEHYSMLGLYFFLRRTMSYEGFQFLGSLPPTIRSDCMSSGDICRDFIHAVDAYFATQIVWKVIGISSQGSLLALSGKYEELMEMYFRIKCYLSNGLIKSSFGQCNWYKIYEYIQDIFQTIQAKLSQSNQSNGFVHTDDTSSKQSNDEEVVPSSE
jgi:hypothetical protein